MPTVESRFQRSEREGTRRTRAAAWPATAAALLLLCPIVVFGAAEPADLTSPLFSILLETQGLPPGNIEGTIHVAGGVAAQPGWQQRFSGLEGTLEQYGIFGFSLILSDWVSIQVDGTFLARLDVDADKSNPEPGFRTSNKEDGGPLRVSTHIRFNPQKESLPAFGAIFAAKLPVHDEAKGIGLDTTDLFATLVAAWRRPGWAVTTNLGVGILTSAETLNEQNDVLVWGLQGERRLGKGWILLGEAQGFESSRAKHDLGTEDRATLKAGLSRWHGRLRWEGYLVQGLTQTEGDLGVAFAVTWRRPGRS